MSRSCHSATSCSPACRLPRTHPGQAADRLGRDRVALVRHRRRALLAGLEALEHLADLGALQMAQLDGDQLARGGRPRDSAHRNSAWRSRAITCVAGTGREPEPLADVAPRPPGRCWSTCRRRPTACRRRPSRGRRRSRAGRGRAAAPTARPWRRTSSARRARRGCARSSPCAGGGGRASTSVDEQRPVGVDDDVERVAHAPSTARCRRRRVDVSP